MLHNYCKNLHNHSVFLTALPASTQYTTGKTNELCKLFQGLCKTLGCHKAYLCIVVKEFTISDSTQMKKSIPLLLYGFIIIFSGLLMIFLRNSSFASLKLALGISLVVGSIFAFITALTRRKRHVQFAYHEMHAVAMMTYSIAILFFCQSFETLNYYTTFLFIFYAFSEIIFCNWLLNLGQKISYKTVFARIIIALFTGIGAVTVISYANTNEKMIYIGHGIIFIILGINILLYTPVMENIDDLLINQNEPLKETKKAA